MKFNETEVWGFKHAFRGIRNPKNSWGKSDSYVGYDEWDQNKFVIGDNDIKLAQQLIKAGNEHRKFLRQIFISVDITAPLYWWKEFDTYKIGTTANSTSTMHKLSTTPITLDCFEIDDYNDSLYWYQEPKCVGDVSVKYESDNSIKLIINMLESLRNKYLETKDKRYWKELIRWLPESWLQTRTVTMNYENIYSIYRHRRNHKLTEWSESFIKWVDSLPYSNELIKCGLEENDEV